MLRRAHNWLLILLMMVSFALRVWGLASLPIWWDEARNIVVASRPIAAIASSGELDIHPPLYFYVLHFWMRWGGWSSPYGAIHVDIASGAVQDGAFAFFLRFLSVWFGLLSVALLYRLGRAFSNANAGLAAAVFGGLAPFWVLEAQQTRMYTLMLALLLGGGLCLWQGVKRAKLKSFAGYGVLAGASLLTHYSAVWVLAGWAIFLAGWTLNSRRQLASRLLKAAIAHLVLLLTFAPQFPIAWRQVRGYANPNLAIPSPEVYITGLARAWTIGNAWNSHLADAMLLAGGIFVLAGLARRYAFTSLRVPSPLLWFVLAWLVPPLMLYYASFFQRGGAFEPRYIACVAPALYLLAGEAGSAFTRRWKPVGFTLLAIAALVLVRGLWAEIEHPSFVREDSRALAAYLAAESTPQDLIITDAPFPFNLYWPGFGEGTPELSPYAPARYLFADIYTLPQTLTRWLRGRRYVFLVHWFKSDADPRRVVQWLLDRHGELVERRDFTGYSVLRYRLPSGEITFTLTPSPVPVERTFDSGLVLEEADWGGREPTPTSLLPDVPYVAPGHKVWVATRWHLTQPTHRTLKVACYLLDETGATIAQDDRWLLNDRHLRTPYWGNLDSSWAFHSLEVPPATLPGKYTITLAVYDEATGERLPLLDEAGNPRGTELRLGSITIVPPPEPTSPLDVRPRFPLSVTLGPVRLLGHDGWSIPLAPGQKLRFRAYWQALSPNPFISVTFSLLSEDGKPVARSEIYPLGQKQRLVDWRAGEVYRSWVALPVPPQLPEGRYALTVEDINLGEVRLQGRPHLFEPPLISNPLEVRFASGILLLGYDWDLQDSTARLTLFWKCLEPITRSYTVFTHLLDNSGRYVTGHDGKPADGKAPTETWLPGEIVVDVHRWELPRDLPPGTYTVEVGMYEADAEGMPRLAVEGGDNSVSWPVTLP